MWATMTAKLVCSDTCFLDFGILLIEHLVMSSAKHSIRQGSFSEPLKYNTCSALSELYGNMLYFIEGFIDFLF